MENIVVLSHEALMSADDIVDRIKTLTGIEFTTTTTTTAENKETTVVKYGCDTSAKSVCLRVGNGDWHLKVDSQDVDSQDVGSQDVGLKVSSVKYDKRIFKPGELVVELTCESTTNKGIVTALKSALYDSTNKKRSTIYFLGYTGDDKGTDKDDLIDVCSKYYVHDFTVSSNSGSIKVVLNCYSPDKLLTLDKYSRVYCGDTFNSKLFNAMEYKPQGLDLNYHVDNIMNAKIYNDDLSLSEIRFPFLVQYNESYYDFLRRIAVRCGEYLFYEDGKLTLGIPEHTKQEAIFVTSGINVKYPHVTLLDTNDTEVKLVTNAIIPTQEERDKLKDAKKEKKDDEKKEESFPSYNMEYTNDDFQKVVDKEDNNDIYNGMYAWEKFTYSALGAALTKATNAETAFSSIVTAYVSAIADAGINRRYLKDNFVDDAEKYANSVGLLPSGGLMNSFYYEIEKIEEKAQKNTVELDYSSTIPNLKLGKAVDLKDGLADFYTVTHVYGEIASDNVKRNMVEIVPTTEMEKTYKKKVKKKVGNKEEETEEFVTEQIPVPIPPHYDIPRIRKAEAQEAVVRDVKDPYLLGRVRVQFLWQIDKDTENIKIYLNDKEEEIKKTNYSPWLRVTVPYVGGNQGGMNMMPEENDHLMVNFVGGNVDMPYIEGFMATCATMPSSGSGLVKNKLDPSFQRKVIASAKGHAITFTDITDKSSILNMVCPPAAAIANMIQGIGKQWYGKTDPLGIDENWAPFTGGITLRDPNGVYELDLSAKNRSIDVKSPFGNVNISAFTGITIDAPNGDITIRGKNVNIEAGNNLTLTSGTNIRNKDFSYKGLGISALAAGLTGAVSIGETALWAEFPWTKEISKLADLSFLRSSWEIIVRPVEGSLKLQSKRNTIITAGNGKVSVPRNSISDALVLRKYKFVKLSKINYLKIESLIQSLKEAHNGSYDTYRNRIIEVCNCITIDYSYLQSIQEALKQDFKDDIQLNERGEFIKQLYQRITREEKLPNWNEVVINNNNHANKETSYNYCVEYFNEARSLFDIIKNKGKKEYVDKIKNTIKKAIKDNDDTFISLNTSFVDNLWSETTMFGFNLMSNDIFDGIDDINADDNRKKTSCRTLIFNFVTVCLEKYFSSNNTYNAAADNQNALWTTWKNSIASKTNNQKMEPSPFGGLVDKFTLGITNFAQCGFGLNLNALRNGSFGRLINYNGVVGPRSVWGNPKEGHILLSNNKAKTMSLNDDGTVWQSDNTSCFYSNNECDAIKEKLDTL